MLNTAIDILAQADIVFGFHLVEAPSTSMPSKFAEDHDEKPAR
jgi:hypothetical protein